MEQPKARPVWEGHTGAPPAEAQQHVTWAREVLAGFIDRRDADGAIRYAAGFMSTIVADAMRGRDVQPMNAARGYALYHVAAELDREPAPVADTSGYRLAGYSGPLRLVESPCACGKTHTVAIPATPGGAR